MSTAAPSSPAHVGTKYRTYKAATDELAKWLATTAKGLDKGLDKEGTLADASNGTNRSHGLKIADFITLTNVIVEAVPKIEVPVKILTLAQKALQARQERAALLGGLDLASDKRHQHVIQVIGEVLQKLKSHGLAAKHASKPKLDVDSEAKDSLSPSFQLLEVESIESGGEDEGDLADAPQAKLNKNKKDKLQKKKKAKEASKQLYLEEEDEDPYFILMCLLSDLKMVREYIKELWQDYKDGRVDLITASLTTNASFDIVRTYEQDCPTTTSLLNDYAKTLKMVLERNLDKSDAGLKAMLKPGIALGYCEFLVEMEAVGDSLSRMPEVADLTLASASYFLNGPRHIVLERLKGGKAQTANPEKCPFGCLGTFQEHFIRDMFTLLSFASNIYQGNVHDRRFFLMNDHITMQWKLEFLRPNNKKITLSQAFGAQIYLDIYHVLGEDMVLGFKDFYDISLKITDSIASWEKQTPQGPMTEIYDFKSSERKIRNVQYLTDKAVNAMRISQSSSAQDDVFSDQIDESVSFCILMTVHPLLCGITLFQLLHVFREAALNLAFQSGTVGRAGQIYYSCHLHRKHWKSKTDLVGGEADLQGSLKERWGEPLGWSDMDYFMKLVGIGAFYDGHIPESNRELIDHLVTDCDKRILMRLKPNCHTHGHCGPIETAPVRGDKDVLSFTKGRITTYEPIAISSRLFVCKYAVKAGQLEQHLYGWTMETLRALLEEQLDEEAKREKALKKKGKGKDKKWAAARAALMKGVDGDVAHITILRTLREALEKESRALHFDMLSFHTSCFHLLSGLRSIFSQVIKDGGDYVTDEYLSDNGNLSGCMCDILTTVNLTGIERGKLIGPSNLPSKNHPFFTSQLQIDIDDYVKRFLEENDCKAIELEKISRITGIAPA